MRDAGVGFRSISFNSPRATRIDFAGAARTLSPPANEFLLLVDLPINRFLAAGRANEAGLARGPHMQMLLAITTTNHGVLGWGVSLDTELPIQAYINWSVQLTITAFEQ